MVGMDVFISKRLLLAIHSPKPRTYTWHLVEAVFGRDALKELASQAACVEDLDPLKVAAITSKYLCP